MSFNPPYWVGYIIGMILGFTSGLLSARAYWKNEFNELKKEYKLYQRQMNLRHEVEKDSTELANHIFTVHDEEKKNG